MKGLKPLALAVSIAALGATGPAAASIYGVSTMDIDNLSLVFVDPVATDPTAAIDFIPDPPTVGNNQQVPGGIPGTFTFQTDAQASLNGANAGAGIQNCANAGCPAGPPVLDSPIAFLGVPADNPGNNNFIRLGPGAKEYSQADAVITAAQLVSGTPTDIQQLAESELQTGSIAGATAVIGSLTGFVFNFTLNAGLADLQINFDAVWDTIAEIQGLNPGDTASSVVSKNVDITLTNNTQGADFGDVISWTPTGCSVTDPTATLNCVVVEGGDLGLDASVADINGTIDRSGMGSFAALFENLTNGNWSLSLASNTEVTISQTRVPEPATLLLLSGGLAGIGVIGRRRRKRVA